MGNIAKGIYTGSPVMPHRDWLKTQAIITKLPELYKKIRELEGKIKELEGRDKPA
jgi:UDP-3-O-[3-hydroxymyristoyl] glucosamine N-acyltransferase